MQVLKNIRQCCPVYYRWQRPRDSNSACNDFKSFVSCLWTTAPYLIYFYIIPYFFNFVKRFFKIPLKNFFEALLCFCYYHWFLLALRPSPLDIYYYTTLFFTCQELFLFFCGFVCQSSRKWRYRPLFHHKHHPTTPPTLNVFLPVQYILAINHCVQMLFTSFDFYIISHYLLFVKYFFKNNYD